MHHQSDTCLWLERAKKLFHIEHMKMTKQTKVHACIYEIIASCNILILRRSLHNCAVYDTCLCIASPKIECVSIKE